MLAFSRQQYLEPESLYLDLLIPDLLGFLQQVVGDNVAIKTRISNGLHRVFADRGQIDNALFHLAANARDAMPGGGTITISAQNIFIDEQEAANHADAESGSLCVLPCMTMAPA